MGSKKSKTKVVVIHLPARVLERWQELEHFLGQSERSIWINTVETTTRSGMIQQVVRNFCLGEWGSWDPDPKAEDEPKDGRLQLKLSQLEELEWKSWIKSGYGSSFSELARRAIVLYLQWSDYLRSENRKLYEKIVELGQAKQIEKIRLM